MSKTNDTIRVLRLLQTSTFNSPQHRRYNGYEEGTKRAMRPESLMKTLGWRVEYLRERVNNWTQTDLAVRLSKRLKRPISQGYISKIERNMIDPPSKFIAALAREFRVNGEYLLDAMSDDPTPRTEDTPDTDIFISEEAGKAAAIIDELSPAGRQEIMRIVTMTAESEQKERQTRSEYYENLMRVIGDELGPEARARLESALNTRSSIGNGEKTPHPI